MSAHTGKVALVVGASSGLGLGIARALLAEGVTVYAAARRLAPMQVLQVEGARLLALDVVDEASVHAAVETILAQAGRIDIVLNNAGYGTYGALEAVPVPAAIRQFEVNVFGLARVNNALLPTMRAQRSGRIIVTASLASHVSTPGLGWYTASKHALKAIAETLRIELAGTGIQVIQIEPGPVRTGFEDVALEGLDQCMHPPGYRRMKEAVRASLARTYARAPGPESTLRAMRHAALAARPRAVYRTTVAARMLPVLRTLLGTRLFGMLVGRAMLGRVRVDAA